MRTSSYTHTCSCQCAISQLTSTDLELNIITHAALLFERTRVKRFKVSARKVKSDAMRNTSDG